MSRFLDPLRYEVTGELSDGRPVYELLERFRYDYSRALGIEQIVWVPAGFRTDLCSTPRLVWILIPPWMGEKAGVIHDWMYRQGTHDRRVADAIYCQALRELGIDPIRRIFMWAAVRVFGWRAYNAPTKLPKGKP
uniref:DUF1353 domain-containing protein n=1 Tax=viral metagenome TaxID=1070528 RepID=A0A6M3KWM3_9ZZZZ